MCSRGHLVIVTQSKYKIDYPFIDLREGAGKKNIGWTTFSNDDVTVTTIFLQK